MLEHRETADRRVRVTALERQAHEAVVRIAAPKRVEPQRAAGPILCPGLRMEVSARSNSLAQMTAAIVSQRTSFGLIQISGGDRPRRGKSGQLNCAVRFSFGKQKYRTVNLTGSGLLMEAL